MASTSEQVMKQPDDNPPHLTEGIMETNEKVESNGTYSSTRILEKPMPEGDQQAQADHYLNGWRLRLVTFALSLSVFLANYEVSIISTSLVAITDALKGFSKSSWIVTAYLLTYFAFLVIWAKLSDIFGRKLCIITAISIFVLFSAGCGASQTITQLIICRAFQGIGGSGIYSLASLMFYELGPPSTFAGYTSLVSAVFALAFVLGPIFGGLINKSSTWRWIFLPNIPAGVVAIVILLIAVPANFPNQGLVGKTRMKNVFSRQALKRVDFLGATLLLAASLLLITALQEAGIQYQWSSPLIVVLLVFAAVFWIAFAAWEYWISSSTGVIEPVLPWKLVNDRVRIGVILYDFSLSVFSSLLSGYQKLMGTRSMFLVGFPFTVSVLEIPQRFQAVNNTSPLGAGIRLFGFIIASPLGAGVCSALAGKYQIPIIHIVLFGSSLQVVGFTLLSRVSTSPTSGIASSVYGFEVLAGFGVGANLAILILIVPFTIRRNEKEILAVAIGTVTQVRFMGGAIGLAVVTSILNSHVRSHLSQTLTPEELSALLKSTTVISTFPSEVAIMARSVLGQGYNNQIKALIGTAVAQFPAALLMWKREQIRVSK